MKSSEWTKKFLVIPSRYSRTERRQKGKEKKKGSVWHVALGGSLNFNPHPFACARTATNSTAAASTRLFGADNEPDRKGRFRGCISKNKMNKKNTAGPYVIIAIARYASCFDDASWVVCWCLKCALIFRKWRIIVKILIAGVMKDVRVTVSLVARWWSRSKIYQLKIVVSLPLF